MKILLGVTGSVAAGLTFKLKEALEKIGTLSIVATESGYFFINKHWEQKPHTGKSCMDVEMHVYRDSHEWDNWNQKSDNIPHITLAQWADVMVIAPLSANTMAKISNGICDNLLTSVVRAWPSKKPFLIAPAMNTEMWNKFSGNHLYLLEHEFPCLKCIGPVEKQLACGDFGVGGMADIKDIAAITMQSTSQIAY